VIEARRLADVLRDRSNPEVKAAYEQMQREVGKVLFKRGIEGTSESEKRDLVLEVTNAFWIHLCENPETLKADAIRGGGAIRTEIGRFVSREGYGASDEDRRKLHLHLYRKVAKSLRESEEFEQVSKNQWRRVGIEADEGAVQDERVLELLEPLPAVLEPQREGQLPPLVRSSVLRAFLVRALELLRRPSTTAHLKSLAWRKLEPNPERVFATAPQSLDGDKFPEDTNESPITTWEFETHVDVWADAFVDSLAPHIGRCLQLLLERRTTKEIASVMGIGKNRVTVLREEFLRHFSIFCDDRGLVEERRRQFRSLVRDRLQVAHFSEDEGST